MGTLEYKQGQRAYMDGKFTSSNPFKPHTEEYRRWFAGFMSGYQIGRIVR